MSQRERKGVQYNTSLGACISVTAKGWSTTQALVRGHVRSSVCVSVCVCVWISTPCYSLSVFYLQCRHQFNSFATHYEPLSLLDDIFH